MKAISTIALQMWANFLGCLGFEAIVLSRDKIFRVGDEFRISAGAQFVKVHALAFAFDGHPEWTEAIEHPIHAIGQRQDKAKQRGDARSIERAIVRKQFRSLRADVTSPATFSTGRLEARKKTRAPRGPKYPPRRAPKPRLPDRPLPCAAQTIPPKSDHGARDRANHNGFRGTTKAQEALLATSPPTQPLALSEASGLPKRILVMSAAVSAAADAASKVLMAINTAPEASLARKQDRAGGIESQPSDQCQQAAEQHEDSIVTGDRGRHAVRGIFAAPRA